MIKTNKFQAQCEAFSKEYREAKAQLPRVTRLSRMLNAPIEAESAACGDLACQRGCHHCCFLRVTAYPHEIVAIYMYLNQHLDKSQLEAVKHRIKKQYAVIRDKSEEEHYTTNVECPLLVHGECTAYAVRPMACAAYHSLSEPQCRWSYENPHIQIHAIPLVPEIQEQERSQRLVAATTLLAHKEPIDEEYELISTLHRLFQDPSQIQRWRAGRRLIEQPDQRSDKQ